MATMKVVEDTTEAFYEKIEAFKSQLNDVKQVAQINMECIQDNRQKFEEVFERQQEVVVGKRNVNCLFCTQDKQRSQSPTNTKMRNVRNQPRILSPKNHPSSNTVHSLAPIKPMADPA